MIFAFASAAGSAEIDDLPWYQHNIRALRALSKASVFQFFMRQYNPDNDLGWTLNDVFFSYDWYPAGDGKYELAVGSQSGPDIGLPDIYWRDAPGRIRSQAFGIVGDASEEWYDDGPQFADLNGDGREELILFDPLEYDSPPQRTKFIPNGWWLAVYRLRNEEYVEASRDFPSFYEN